MKRVYIIIILISTIGFTKAQNYFQNTLGISASSEIMDVVETQDGGFAMVLTTTDYDPMNMTNYTAVVKIDVNGDTLWVTGMGTTSNSIDTTSDGGLIVAGNEGGAILTKLSTTGDIEWTKRYSSASAKDAHQTADGGYLIGTYAYGIGVSSDFLLIKTDLNGDTLWTKSYDTGEQDVLYAMNLTNDGGCIMGGTLFTSPYNKFLMIKVDALGNVEFSKTYITGFGGFDMGLSDIIQLSNSEYVAVGGGGETLGSLYFPYAVKMDASGVGLWSGDYRNESGVKGSFTGVSESLDGNIVMSGHSDANGYDLVITKINASTNQGIWRQQYGTDGYDYGNSIASTSDGSIVVAGKGGFNTPYNGAYIIKADDLGNSKGCFNSSGSYGSPGGGYVDPIAITIGGSNVVVSDLTMTKYNGLEFHKLIPNIELSKTDPLCIGDCNGTASVISTEGQTPYDILWSTGGALSTELGLCASTHFVTVTDDAGCDVFDSVTLVNPTAIEASAVVSHVTCFGNYDGAVDITVSGGTPGYSYSWPTGDTTQNISGLSGGYFQVLITDTNGCEKILGAIVQEPQPLATYITETTHPSCNGFCDGELASFTVGGTQPYSILWNDDLSQITDTATNLCDGTYLIMVTDDNGCVAFANGTIDEPEALNSTMSSSPSQCGLSVGVASVVVNGGTMPYQYTWSDSPSTDDTALDLSQGTHTVTITDENGCIHNNSVVVETSTETSEICMVTVNDDNRNLVVWEKPIAGNIAGYNIYRNSAGTYTQIAFQDYDAMSEFIDLSFGVDPSVTSYRYKISVVDTCGNESPLSDFHETIHLTANIGTGNEVNLIWDDYEGVLFSSYDILFDETGTGTYTVLATVPNTNFTYTHLNPPTDMDLRYKIGVNLPNSCIPTSSSKASGGPYYQSVSNIEDEGIISTNIDKRQLQGFVKIFPNPTKGELTIASKAIKLVEIVDVSGQVISKHESNSDQIKIDISDQAKGVYFVKVINNTTTSIHKIILE